MILDTPTLFLMSVALTLVIGLMFLLSWNQERGTRALAIWGAAHLLGGVAAAMLCLRGIIPDSLSIGLGNALMLGAYGLSWSGQLSFERRPPAYRAAFAGGLVWILACLVPDFYGSVNARLTLASVLGGLYCPLGAWVCWQGRAERLVSRATAIVLLAGYAALYWVRLPLLFLVPQPLGERPLETPWLGALCFVSVLLTVAIAFVLMALTKERAEREQRRAAETDALTGLANRRAFVASAESACADRARPLALLVFDLDHFKAINDTYGHEVGDGALVAFAHLARAVLPPGAVIGRLGGEEFACLVPLGTSEAFAAAERLRLSCAAIALPDYPGLAIRVSVGLAAKDMGECTRFASLMRAADHALYAAKHAGRDRVVRASEAAPAREAIAAPPCRTAFRRAA